MEGLFPGLPEDLKALSDEELAEIISDHEAAIEKIKVDDEEFLKGLSGEDVIAQLEGGVKQLLTLREEATARAEAHQAYVSKKDEIVAQLTAEEPSEEEALEVVAENEDSGDEDSGDEDEGDEAEAVEQVLVTASANTTTNATTSFTMTSPRYSRTPPAPAPGRIVVNEVAPAGTALVAAGEMSLSYRDPLTPDSLAHLVRDAAVHHGPHPKVDPPGKYRFGGPEHKIARADFSFPSERTLDGRNIEDDLEKIREVLPEHTTLMGKPGGHGGEALTASGGLCAPLTPIYTIPNFGTTAEPVWDSLPVFRAERGGVNVPEATYIADITTAISSISEANDALGGTFATKSCQDLDCPDYTETAVQILAHCREYGNLNARAWPEKIAHENALTMQALARTSENFMLERIKELSVNVTNGAETLGALIYLVDAIVKARFGIIGRLRMPRETRFRALLPAYTLDLLLLDTIQTQFDRFRSKEELNAYLRSAGIDPVYYLDGNFATGTAQIPDASQGVGALDGLPDTMQWALYPEGAFIGIDMGTLELGIVRDSTLNSTNDFQVFGERFRNLARLAPAQACYWVTSDLCASGQFPPAGTVRTCD